MRDLGVTVISIHTKEEQMASNMQGGSGMVHGGEGMKKVLSRDKKMVLSTLWIFTLINYINADLFNLAFPLPAAAGTAAMTNGTLLVLSVLMETAIVMVLLSRVLKRGLNRWLNIIVGVIQTAFVGWSLFVGAPRPFYVFFVSIEVASLLFIVVYALMWKREQAHDA
jgi:hypothetical protein